MVASMKLCGITWSVASDDFVITSIVGIIIHTVWLVGHCIPIFIALLSPCMYRLLGLIAFTLIVLVGRDCFPDGPREEVVFTFIFSQIATQVLVIISEVLVAFVSSRGTINNDKPRRLLPYFLCIRAILYVLEILGIVLGGYVAWSPYIQNHIHCERSNRVSQAIEAYVISVIVVHVLIAVLFMVFFDPLGLQSPSLLKDLRVFVTGHDDNDGGNEDDNKTQQQKHDNKKKTLYRAQTWRLWGRRAKLLCCCVRGNNNTSKVQALEDIAHAMATMFHDVEMVPTEFVAGLMLVHRDQKAQMKQNLKCDLGAQLKRVSA